MKIEKNTMVEFHYSLKDAENNRLLETSYDIETKKYIHGVSEMLDGLFTEFSGKSSGDEFEITLPPEKAYGLHNPNAVGRVSKNYVYLPGGLPVKGKLEPGTYVEVVSEQGVLRGSVIKQGLKTVDIDANHPYAGKSLTFAVEVVDVRAATDDELAEEMDCDTGCGCC